MKKYIYSILFVTLVAFVVVIFNQSSGKAKALHTVADLQASRAKDRSHAKSANDVSGATDKKSSMRRPRVDFSMYIDLNQVARAVHLTERQVDDLRELLLASRESVLESLAEHGKLERLDERTIKWTVVLPSDLAESQRQIFYRRLGSIVGIDRMNDFTSAVNLAKFEAALEFFGVFPAIYEFETPHGALARADFVETRTTIVRKDAYGSYNSFWEEKFIMEDFRAKFGALAERGVSNP